jgi:hypothetical protein
LLSTKRHGAGLARFLQGVDSRHRGEEAIEVGSRRAQQGGGKSQDVVGAFHSDKKETPK